MIINFANLGGGGGGGTTYTAGDYIEISGSTISVTGVTTDEEGEVISRAINDLNDRNGEKVKSIDTLPENPEDGAIYNYQGRLIKYVNGPGKWGEWLASPRVFNPDTNSANALGVATLSYATLPASIDGQMICYSQVSYTSSYNLYFFFDLQNDVINVYSNSAGTGTTSFVISKNGPAVSCNSDSNRFTVKWKDGSITFTQNYGYSVLISTSMINTSTGNPHYEIAEALVNPTQASSASAYTVYMDTEGRVLGPGQGIVPSNIYINGYLYSSSFCKPVGGSTIPNFFAPNQSGNAGELLISAGSQQYTSTPPVWKTVAQALGVDFWTGTQDEYDALAPDYNATTLYIIVEEE